MKVTLDPSVMMMDKFVPVQELILSDKLPFR